jgi:long-subunit acyl-CoA synthetase (AMP-forming)
LTIVWSPQAEYDSGKPDDVYLAYLPLAHIMEVPAIFFFCLPRLPAPRIMEVPAIFVFVFLFCFFGYLAYLPLAHILEVPAS